MVEQSAPATMARRGRAHVLLLCAAFGCAESAPERSAQDAELLHRILIAEDSRASDPQALAPITEGLAHPNPEVRRIAVRAMGRLERSELIDQIEPLLADSVPVVRAEAANAVAQAAFTGESGSARSLLRERLTTEANESVQGALGQSLGRLRHTAAADVASSAAAIVGRANGQAAGPASGERDMRFAKGLNLLARQPAARQALPEAVVSWLRGKLTSPVASPDRMTQRTRTVALAALMAAGHATADDLDRGLADPDPLVRREVLAVPRALTQLDSAQARALVTNALADSSAMVRFQALNAWTGLRREGECDVPARLARDPNAHVAVRATELLGNCAATPATLALLDSLVLALPASGPGWHVPAWALVSLSALDASRVAERLDPFARHANPFVRAYAARAVVRADQVEVARTLARDPDPNVRTAAIESLVFFERRAADPILVEQLAQDDPQLLMTASRLLEGTRDARALPALLDAFDRLTAARRETSRDARRALLQRAQELGSVADTGRVVAALQDFDPEVAALAADVLADWGGATRESRPTPLPEAEVPTPAALDSLEGAIYTVTMADGGSFDLLVRAWDAPTNASRFARLADAGYFDGLTYHRVAPNFVIQGGSPAANEYAGDGPFTRDELGLDGHWRGTAGISTRGHDTGDAQMFINLIDNVRLDHTYTVFAQVVRGMEVVDRVLEGDVIQGIRRTAGTGWTALR